jgi:hypothetical protein
MSFIRCNFMPALARLGGAVGIAGAEGLYCFSAAFFSATLLSIAFTDRPIS